MHAKKQSDPWQILLSTGQRGHDARSAHASGAWMFLSRTLVFFLAWTLGWDSLWAQQNWFKPIIDATQPKLVKVSGAGAGNVDAYASGVIVSGDGKIIAPQGVFLDGNQVQVMLADGRPFPATVVRRDRRLQLAYLQIEGETPDYFQLSDQAIGDQGDWVVAISNAFKVADKSEPLSVMLGVISLRTSIDAKLNDRDVAYSGPLVLIDAITSNPGAAGGAVVNREGQLVGMIGKIIDSTDTNTRLNYAVPQAELLRFLKGEAGDPQVTEAVEAGNPLDLGIRIFTLSGRTAAPYVDKVDKGGLAQVAGIRPDDLVISINGEKVSSVKEYLGLVETLTDQRATIIVVARGAKLLRFEIGSQKGDSDEAGDTPDGQPNVPAVSPSDRNSPSANFSEPARQALLEALIDSGVRR